MEATHYIGTTPAAHTRVAADANTNTGTAPHNASQGPLRTLLAPLGALSAGKQKTGRRINMPAWLRRFSQLAFLLLPLLASQGCGGGYPGLGLTVLTAAATAIDAGQTVAVTAVGTGKMDPIVWSVGAPGGGGCGPQGCGSLSGSGGKDVYTAPIGISAPIQVVITGTVPGTTDTRSTTITVNPDPSISGLLPAGTVGVPYSATCAAPASPGLSP